MRHFIAVLFALLAASCAPSTSPPVATAAAPAPIMRWSDLLSRPKPSPTHVIRLGEKPHEVADLWLPDGAGPFPVVLMVHGGCWQKSIADRTLMNYAAEALRREGLAVWNIEYRGVDEDGGGYPGTFLDAARATDALRDAARTYPLKIDRVVAFGHSAGGHLALWLAARPRLPAGSALRTPDPLPIAAVVNAGGLADLRASIPVTLTSCLSDIADKLVGAATPARPDPFADTSPAELLPAGAVLVNLYGQRDRIAPPVLGEQLSLRARLAGDRATSIVIADEGHVELVAPDSTAFSRATKELLALAGHPAGARSASAR